MSKEYIPKPIDTSDVTLPQSLTELTEQLAKNVHETWAEGRLSQGWRLGATRNDATREHPCLIAYEELSEEERDYDRHTALSTLKLIYKLGYKIVPADK